MDFDSFAFQLCSLSMSVCTRSEGPFVCLFMTLICLSRDLYLQPELTMSEEFLPSCVLQLGKYPGSS